MTRKRWVWSLSLWLLGLFICCFPARKALAENWSRPEGGLSASVWAGYYLPQDSRFQQIYNDNGRAAGFMEFSKTWSTQIEATLGLGGSYFRGHTLNHDGNSSRDRAKLALAAGYIQGAYLFRYKQEQRLVPYLGGGLDVFGYQEKKEGSDDSIEGCKYGCHGLAGVRFLLDWLDPQAAGEALRDYGIKNSYLVLEACWLQIDNFGEHKLDLSGPLYRIGLLWEF